MNKKEADKKRYLNSFTLSIPAEENLNRFAENVGLSKSKIVDFLILGKIRVTNENIEWVR